MAEPRRFAAIVNPISGRQGMLSRVRIIARALERCGGRLDVMVTQGPRHATQLAADLPDNVEAVLVVGGDGTVGEVANGLTGRVMPMLILRTGTENLLARELGMPTDPERITETLLRGEPFSTDVGIINERRFLAIAGIGFDAECVVRMNPPRRGHITHGDYFWPIWRTYWAYRYPKLRVEADEDLVFDGRGFALVGNVAQYSAGLRILSRARNDDGLLDLGIFPCNSRRRMLGHACRAFLRCHLGFGGMIYRQCRMIRISSDADVPIEVDGELGGRLPAECSLRSRAASFLRLPSKARNDIEPQEKD